MKRNFIKLIGTLFLILTIHNACNKKVKKIIVGEDDKLSIVKVNYQGRELKMDGYYYLKVNSNIIDSYFFYRDGVLIDCGGAGDTPNTLSFLENNFNSPQYNATIKQHKLNWGVFKIEGNNISFERWYPGEGPLKSYIRFGEIMNDTTFKINSSTRSDGSELREKDETYHFKKFLPKPDSTNGFVK